MAKKIIKLIKLQIPAGKANPAPPIGPALGAAGVNIMAFCKEYNAKTQDKAGKVLPVIISVFSDKTFAFMKSQKREKDWVEMKADEWAEFDENMEIDLNTLEPLIAHRG